jgi:hypothetical protein
LEGGSLRREETALTFNTETWTFTKRSKSKIKTMDMNFFRN